MSDYSPKVGYTRFMAFIAFFFCLAYIWFYNENLESAVLWFCAYIISIWALGRVTLMEALDKIVDIKQGREKDD